MTSDATGSEGVAGALDADGGETADADAAEALGRRTDDGLDAGVAVVVGVGAGVAVGGARGDAVNADVTDGAIATGALAEPGCNVEADVGERLVAAGEVLPQAATHMAIVATPIRPTRDWCDR